MVSNRLVSSHLLKLFCPPLEQGGTEECKVKLTDYPIRESLIEFFPVVLDGCTSPEVPLKNVMK